MLEEINLLNPEYPQTEELSKYTPRKYSPYIHPFTKSTFKETNNPNPFSKT